MATLTGNYVCDNSTLANFKNWAMAISGAFASLGWVQTADTGQVNWSTISAVPASTYVYEIWKAADSQAATLPIYVKMEYGFSSTSIRILVTAGTGSNGSGTITGGVMSNTPRQFASAGNEGATALSCFFSGDAGEFRMYMWQSVSLSTGVVLGIERCKDSVGAKTADYFTVLAANNGLVIYGFQQTILSSTLVASQETGVIGLAFTGGSGTGAFNGTVASLPVFPLFGKVGNPMLGFQTCCAADVTDGTTVTVAALYDQTHTFIAAVGNTISACIGSRQSEGTTMALLMRYE